MNWELWKSSFKPLKGFEGYLIVPDYKYNLQEEDYLWAVLEDGTITSQLVKDRIALIKTKKKKHDLQTSKCY
jgi:hypothetical protein